MYPRAPFHIIRAIAFVCASVVSGILIYFCVQLKHDGFKVPWTFIVVSIHHHPYGQSRERERDRERDGRSKTRKLYTFSRTAISREAVVKRQYLPPKYKISQETDVRTIPSHNIHSKCDGCQANTLYRPSQQNWLYHMNKPPHPISTTAMSSLFKIKY